MGDDDDENAETQAVIRGYVWRWAFAVQQQKPRVLDPAANEDHETDAHFFAVALNNLRRSVEWGRDFSNGIRDAERGRALAAALTRFDTAVPDAQHVRDVQEHFVDYVMGTPQRRLPVPAPLAIWWARAETSVTVHVGGKYELDVGSASAAADALARDALDALS